MNLKHSVLEVLAEEVTVATRDTFAWRSAWYWAWVCEGCSGVRLVMSTKSPWLDDWVEGIFSGNKSSLKEQNFESVDGSHLCW